MPVHQPIVQLEQQRQTQEITILHIAVQICVVNPELEVVIVLFVPHPLV